MFAPLSLRFDRLLGGGSACPAPEDKEVTNASTLRPGPFPTLGRRGDLADEVGAETIPRNTPDSRGGWTRPRTTASPGPDRTKAFDRARQVLGDQTAAGQRSGSECPAEVQAGAEGLSG